VSLSTLRSMGSVCMSTLLSSSKSCYSMMGAGQISLKKQLRMLKNLMEYWAFCTEVLPVLNPWEIFSFKILEALYCCSTVLIHKFCKRPAALKECIVSSLLFSKNWSSPWLKHYGNLWFRICLSQKLKFTHPISTSKCSTIKCIINIKGQMVQLSMRIPAKI
jgi:hypothetical protein